MRPVFALAAIPFLFASQIATAESSDFSVPKIAAVYVKIEMATAKKTAKIPRLTADERANIKVSLLSVKKAFLNLDRQFSSSEVERAQAVRQLVRSYSNLNRLVARIRDSKTVAATPSELVPSSSVLPVGTPVDVLYYADSFEGRGTSNGDQFSQSAWSAARCGISLGKLIQVHAGGKSVVVKANDRPNCEKHPDIVDLSKSAFSSLSALSAGRLKGSFVELGSTPAGYRKEFLDPSAFSELGIRLSDRLPNTYLKNETFRISGRVTDSKTDTVLFLKAPSGARYSRSVAVASDSTFSYEIPLVESGRYDLVVSSGMGFSTTETLSVHVFDPSVVENRSLTASNSINYDVGTPKFVRYESSDLSPMLVFDLPESRDKLFKTVRISQPGKPVLVRSSMGDVAFSVEDATAFDPTLPIKVTVTAQASSTEFSLDAYSGEKKVYDEEMVLASAYKTERKEDIDAFVENNRLVVRARSAKGHDPLRTEAYLTLPDGNVKTLKFAQEFVGSDGYLVRDVKTRLEIPLTTAGQYMVEIMYSNGFPAYNAPFSYGAKVAAILPNEYDSAGKNVESGALSAEEDALRFINSIRKKASLSPLSVDAKLRALAEFKAEDMAKFNYVGHDDSAGQKIGLTAKRAGISVAGSLGENVAWGSVGFDYLLAGLALSGGHRANMLGDWTKVGIAAVTKDGLTYYVQIFGE